MPMVIISTTFLPCRVQQLASLALKLVCLLSYSHLSQKSQQEPKCRERREDSHAGQAAAWSGSLPLWPVGQTWTVDGVTGGYRPDKAQLTTPFSTEPSGYHVGMRPSFWAYLPQVEREEL